jgi:hypothetical protein
MGKIPVVPALQQVAAVAQWLAPARAPWISAAPDLTAAQVRAAWSRPWPNR